MQHERTTLARKRTLFLRHFLVWAVACVVWFFSVEPLLHWTLPGMHGVEHWLQGEAIGLGLISLLIIISFVSKLVRRQRVRAIR